MGTPRALKTFLSVLISLLITISLLGVPGSHPGTRPAAHKRQLAN